jgi:aminoglycoside phosphotransferase family enzyme/predicted kinase
MERNKEHEAIVRWLTRPASYRHSPDRVEHVETHISDVFLAGPFVYKLKKPVRYEFLDFSTVGQRHQACRDELRLNRRLAPDTYLDVLPIVRGADGGYKIGGDGETAGETVDWLVQMRRLPTELSLEALQRRGELEPQHIDRLAEVLNQFYGSLAPLPLSPQEYLDRCRAHVRGNFQELLAVRHHLPMGAIERIHGHQLQFLALQPAVFAERARHGRIVEGHGDLRPEHICLGEPPVIFDCVEFSRDFRSVDVADELAFLAAECDFLGADWIGPRLFTAYQASSRDQPPQALVDFYKSYRACVRSKVAALRADQLEGEQQAAAIGEATARLAWADRYVEPWVRPLVLVVGGLAGTGKSTLAKALANEFGAELLRTDVIRKELFVAPAVIDSTAGDMYSAAARKRVYDELFRRAAALNAERISVVLDATFSAAGMIERARLLAAKPRSIWLAIECVCPADVAHERIARRLAEERDASEARPEIHDAQRETWAAWPPELPQVRVDTTKSLQEQVEQVVAALLLNTQS